MQCRRCGAALGEGHRFCGDCGGPVGGCPACGEALTPGKRFCHACGFALADIVAVPAVPAPAVAAGSGLGREPAAERRVCSVLFCDVVGFTPLSEARDPEAVRELLSQYFRVARTVIIRYGGVVEKFIGDAVMARPAVTPAHLCSSSSSATVSQSRLISSSSSPFPDTTCTLSGRNARRKSLIE